VFARLGRDTAYILVGFPLAVTAFSVTVTLLTTGVALLITLVGLPILILTAYVARGFARVERENVRRLLGVPALDPTYLRSDPSASRLKRVMAPLTDPQSWLDIAFTLVSFVTATVTFTVALTWWAVSLAAGTYPLFGWTLSSGPNSKDLPELLGLGGGPVAKVMVNLVFGLVLVVLLPVVMRFLALGQSALSRFLLCRRAGLQHQVADLQQGRVAARSAESSALRRLERDIHDGPQQRLVRLSIDLGRAGKQLDHDTEAARAIIEGAIGQARETLDELRALSRGIAPPVLVEALEEICARASIPVRLDVSLPRDLPEHVQTATYFVVSEALTNVAKHSGATSVEVTVRSENGVALVEVTDNGAGCAHLSKGRGLAGLTDRVRALDGSLSLSSPPGGPTVVSAEIPCAS
jgi:signal transduction histidine kinase